jgi:hypothetical protein
MQEFEFNIIEVQFNSIQIQVACNILQYFSFEWNLMPTKSIHYSHQLISTGTGNAVQSPSENFQILSI